MSLTAIILSYERSVNIGKTVASVLENTVTPEEIIVFNNNKYTKLEVEGATVINSGKNFGCRVRHAIGQVADSTHLLFIDDDLMLKPTTIEKFLKWSEVYPESILGLLGKRLNKGKYSGCEGISLDQVNLQEVDVVLGRVHFCRKQKLSLPFYYGFETGEDDIALSLANKKAGFKNYVIPNDGVIELPQHGHAVSNRPDHIDRRDEACEICV